MKPLTQATADLFSPVTPHKNDRLHLELDREGKNFHFTFYSLAYDGRKTGPSYRTDTFINRFPEKKALDGWPPKYEIACTDWTAILIDQVWPRDQLEIDADAKLVLQYLLATCRQQDDNAHEYAKFKQYIEYKNSVREITARIAEAHAPLEVSGDYECHPDWPLAAYQNVPLGCAMKSEGYGLFMEQGTGKTPIVIARICNDAKRLREGTLDIETLRQTEAQILARCETEIKKETDAATQAVADMIQAKRSKLENAAKKAAARKEVSLDYTGAASELLARAQDAVAEAGRWLSRKMREIDDQIAVLEYEEDKKLTARITELTADLNAQAKRDVAKLKSKHRPPETRMHRSIIVVPNNLRLNWFHEFVKFTTRQGKVTIIRGGVIARTKQLIDAFTPDDENDEFTCVVISYDTLKQHWDKGLSLIEWDLAVLDESHFIKWPETGRHKYCMKLRDKSKKRMVLTGTPITNTGLDLYAQFEFLGDGWSGFGDWKNFRTFYGVYKPTASGRQALAGMQNLPFIQERLARLSFSVEKSEVLPYLPKKSYDIWEVEMTKVQKEMYAGLRDRLAVEIENDLAKDTKSIVITNILTKLLRLAQVTSGHIKWDDVVDDEGEVLQAGKIERFKNNPKIAAVLELLKDKGPDNKTIVWATWVEDIKHLSEALTEAGINHVSYYGSTSEKMREEAVQRFNKDPECKVFIGNAAAGGVGLNLVGFDPERPEDYASNCDHVIYFSMNWSAVHRAQSEDRAHRRITRIPVRYTDLVVANTIDEEIRDRVTMKRLTASSIADIRDILRNVLNSDLTATA